MINENVIDIRTKKALFGSDVRHRLHEGMKPYLREGTPEEAIPERAVNTVEQIICTALVSAGIALAVKMASKVSGLFMASQA